MSRPDDKRYDALRRLVTLAGAIARPGDLEWELLAKYLAAIGGIPRMGDQFNMLLAKVVTLKGGFPKPGDNEWNLLKEWLATLGQCTCSADTVVMLWRKIMDAEIAAANSGPVPGSPEVRVQLGGTPVLDGQGLVIDYGASCQGGTTASKTYTVFNDGTTNLTTSGLSVPSGFSIIENLSATIIPGSSDTFTVAINILSPVGMYPGNISFANNDSNENPFNFPITGEIQNPLAFDTVESDNAVPWHGRLQWVWPGGDVTCTPPDPAHFGIELSQDGGAFGNLLFEAGSARIHDRASDGLPHTWIFRVAAFDSGFNRITDWVQSDPFDGPTI